MDIIFYITIFLFVMLFGSLDINIDVDFWARLIVGKTFFQTGSLLNNDFYSYGQTHEFIDHEWGSSLIFYLIQNHFGDVGIYIFKTLIIFLTFFIITKTIRLKNPSIKLYFLFFFFAIQSVSYGIFSTIRCQTFSFLFFVLYVYILEKARIGKNYKLLWTLPILNIIWANIHGGFILGLVLICFYSLGEFLNKEMYKPFLTAFFISCLTSLINPYGIKYIIYIFNAFSLNRNYIIEWQSAFFNHNYIFVLLKFKILFFIAMIMFLYSVIKSIKNLGFSEFYKKIDKVKYLILIFSIIISLKSLRCHTFFTYSLLIFCYGDFYEIFNKKLPVYIDNTKEIILFLLILISTISHLYKYKFQNIVNESFYPVNCVEFIKINNLKGNIFTMFQTGSYVAYKLYPNNYVFMDGRYEEIYDDSLIKDMAKFYLDINHKNFLEKYHTDIIILDSNYKDIEKSLKEDKDWFLAYQEKYYSLFLPSNLKNKKFIQPTKINKQHNQEKFETNINWL